MKNKNMIFKTVTVCTTGLVALIVTGCSKQVIESHTTHFQRNGLPAYTDGYSAIQTGASGLGDQGTPGYVIGNTKFYPSQSSNQYGERVYQDPITKEWVGLVPGGAGEQTSPIYNAWKLYDQQSQSRFQNYQQGYASQNLRLPVRDRMLQGYPVGYREYVQEVSDYRYRESKEVPILGIKKIREIHQRVERERLTGDGLIGAYSREFGLSTDELKEIFLYGILKKHVLKVSTHENINHDQAQTLLGDLRRVALSGLQ